MLDSAYSAPTVPPALERARRLFEFLTRAQELKSAPVRDVASYEYALWLGELPQHPAVSVGDHTFEADSPVLKLERIVLAEAPEPSPLLHPWLSQRHDNSSSKPGLKSELADGRQLADNPPIQRAYQTWLESWQTWAERDRLDRQLQEVYKALFATYVKASSRPEEFQLVLGSACLAWAPPGVPAVRRHLFVSALRLELDEQSGALTAAPDAASGLNFEIDALDPGQIPHAFNIQAVRRRATEFGDHPLDSQAVGVLGRVVLNGLDRMASTLTHSSDHRSGLHPAGHLLRRSSSVVGAAEDWCRSSAPSAHSWSRLLTCPKGCGPSWTLMRRVRRRRTAHPVDWSRWVPTPSWPCQLTTGNGKSSTMSTSTPKRSCRALLVQARHTQPRPS